MAEYTIIHGDGSESLYDVWVHADGRFEVIDRETDERQTLDVAFLPGGRLHLFVGGASHEASVGIVGTDVESVVDGVRHELSVYNGQALAQLRLTAATNLHFKPDVQSPMSGRVITLHVGVGDTVEPGDALLVIEAMKMENIIRTTHAGTVSKVSVEAGEAVETNAHLMTIEPDEEA